MPAIDNRFAGRYDELGQRPVLHKPASQYDESVFVLRVRRSRSVSAARRIW